MRCIIYTEIYDIVAYDTISMTRTTFYEKYTLNLSALRLPPRPTKDRSEPETGHSRKVHSW